jgi:pimeloyl-ACP methyl ester carboxylesterase
MPKVKVGDINMYYEVHGKGEPLVFFAGLGVGTEVCTELIPVYSPEYRLVLFDNRGAGRSDAPDIPYTMEMFADDLAGLLDAIDISSAHVYGISLGGGIALCFTLIYPDRVKSLVLSSTHCGGPHMVTPDAEITKTLTNLAQANPEERAEGMMRLNVTPEFAARNPAIMQEMRKERAKQYTSSQGTMRQQQVSCAIDIYERLPEIKAPTLIIHGDADRLVPVENARIMAPRIRNAELVILKNAGHILIEAGNEPNQIVLDFLRRHRRSR